MKNRGQINGLLDNLDRLADECGDQIRIGDIVECLGARGFGPLLAVSAAFLITPIGMIPGMPTLIAVILFAIAIQMFRGQRGLWLPERIRRIAFSTATLKLSIQKARPAAGWLRHLLTRRLAGIIDNPVAPRAVAALLLISTVALVVVGFVPGLPFVIGLYVALIGLAMIATDGVVFLIGLSAILPAGWLIWQLVV